jgi:hypothetical protein
MLEDEDWANPHLLTSDVVCLASSIGWAAANCAHYAVGSEFDPRGKQVDSAVHPFVVDIFRNS